MWGGPETKLAVGMRAEGVLNPPHMEPALAQAPGALRNAGEQHSSKPVGLGGFGIMATVLETAPKSSPFHPGLLFSNVLFFSDT